MSRRVITIAAIVLGCGALVAYVRAQDAATRSVLRSINDSNQEPTLASPPTSARRMQESTSDASSSRYSIGDAGEAAAPPTTGRRMSLADRLQQVRESATQVTDGSPRALPGGASVTSPVLANPVTAVPTNREPAMSDAGQGTSVVSPSRVADERGAISSQRYGDDAASTPYSARRIPRAPVPSAPTYEQPTNEGPSAEQSPSDYTDEPPTFEEPAAAAPSDTAPSFSQPPTILGTPQTGAARPRVSSRPISGSGSLLSSVGPQIRVETVGPRSVMVGKPAEYTITVSNTGAVAASELYVRVSLPSWVEVQADNVSSGATQTQAEAPGQQKLVWTIEQIEPQSQQTLKLLARPNTNRPFDLMVDWTLRPISGVTQIEVQQPRLEMAVFGPKNVLYGESAVYTIQLTNPGTGSAENVALEFSYGTRRLEKKIIGNIAPGEQNEVNVELTAQQAGQLRVAAVATADGGLKAEANEEILVRRAELEVAVTGSSLKFAGGVSTYKVRVKNIGDATANAVAASIVLPPGAIMVGAQGKESGSVLQDIGALLPGAERVIGVQCQLMTPGENRIDAVVKSEGGLEKSASFTTRVEALADLKLTVSDPSGPTALGTNAVYEVHITNRGSKAAERIKIVAQFSEGVEPQEANGGAADIVPGQVLFHPISRIEPGAELVLKIIAKADKAGNHRFRAELTAGDPDTRLIAEESTYYFGEDATRTAAQPATEAATR